MSQQNLEQLQAEQDRQRLLKINTETLRERKLEISLMLWEMSELFQVHNEGADEKDIQQFQNDCFTLRQIIRYI